MKAVLMFATLRNHLQPSATVCNRSLQSATVFARPSWQKVAVPMGKLQKAFFLLFEVLRSFISRGRRGTLEHVAAHCCGRKLPCLWEKLHNASLSGSVKCDIALCCVVGVAFCGMWTCDQRAIVVAESSRAYEKSCKRCDFRSVREKRRPSANSVAGVAFCHM